MPAGRRQTAWADGLVVGGDVLAEMRDRSITLSQAVELVAMQRRLTIRQVWRGVKLWRAFLAGIHAEMAAAEDQAKQWRKAG